MAKKEEAQAKEQKEQLSRISFSDLIEEIFQNQTEDMDYKKKDINTILRLTMSTIHKLLEMHCIVALPDLFILKPAYREARMAHNPQKPGEKIEVPAGWTLKVKASSSLKEDMNS